MNINVSQYTYRLTGYPGGTEVPLGPMPDGYEIDGGNVAGQNLFCARLAHPKFKARDGQIMFSAKLPQSTPAVTVVVRFKPQAERAA